VIEPARYRWDIHPGFFSDILEIETLGGVTLTAAHSVPGTGYRYLTIG
jgi:hypothetical protein